MSEQASPIKIQLLVYPGFTLLDLVGPAQVWSVWPGAEMQYVWKKKGAVPTDTHLPVEATSSFDEAWRDPDIFFAPGGMHSTFELLEDEETMDFVAQQGHNATWNTAVCTGSIVLGGAGLLTGRKATSHWYCFEGIEHFGATPTKGRYVIDRNANGPGGVATGGGVTAGVDFGIALVSEIAGEDLARLMQLLIEYRPQPPFQSGHPDEALPETLKAANDLWQDFGSWASDRMQRAGNRLAAQPA